MLENYRARLPVFSSYLVCLCSVRSPVSNRKRSAQPRQRRRKCHLTSRCAIQWIVICYPVDSAIQRLNNQGLDRSWILNDRIYVQTKELRKSSSSVYVYNVAKKSTIKCDKLTEFFFAYKDPLLF